MRIPGKAEIQLTVTSYIVLGLLSLLGEASPYDLKRFSAESVGHIWMLPHSQLYAEPVRLASAGYLTEKREDHGRRRKLYALTESGARALQSWLGVRTPEVSELRDLATLKLFFGGDPQELANAQIETYEGQLEAYEELRKQKVGGLPQGPWLALDHGIAHINTALRWWSKQARGNEDS